MLTTKETWLQLRLETLKIECRAMEALKDIVGREKVTEWTISLPWPDEIEEANEFTDYAACLGDLIKLIQPIEPSNEAWNTDPVCREFEEKLQELQRNKRRVELRHIQLN